MHLVVPSQVTPFTRFFHHHASLFYWVTIYTQQFSLLSKNINFHRYWIVKPLSCSMFIITFYFLMLFSKDLLLLTQRQLWSVGKFFLICNRYTYLCDWCRATQLLKLWPYKLTENNILPVLHTFTYIISTIAASILLNESCKLLE